MILLRAALLLLVAMLAGCATCDTKGTPAPGNDLPPPDALWVTNSSPTNFADVDEVFSHWPAGFGGVPARFEGVFDAYAESDLAVAAHHPWTPKGYKSGIPPTALLTPEVEWVIYFPDPAALAACLDHGGDWATLPVEVRAMIEGKWFDDLWRDADGRGGPRWRQASMGNNVVASGGHKTTLGAVEEFLGNPKSPAHPELAALCAEVECLRPKGLSPTRFISEFSDFATGEVNTTLQTERPGHAMEYLIREVHGHLRRRTSSNQVARAINLSCFGDTPALVCNPLRRARARLHAMFWYPLLWDRDKVARRGMKILVRQVLEEDLASLARTGRRVHGLNPDERFRLTLWRDGSRLGVATLRFETPADSRKAGNELPLP